MICGNLFGNSRILHSIRNSFSLEREFAENMMNSFSGHLL